VSDAEVSSPRLALAKSGLFLFPVVFTLIRCPFSDLFQLASFRSFRSSVRRTSLRSAHSMTSASLTIIYAGAQARPGWAGRHEACAAWAWAGVVGVGEGGGDDAEIGAMDRWDEDGDGEQ
jgi:hypothetical protein